MMKKIKAQTLVFENVLLFGIGVAIFVLCYAVFTSYQLYFSGVGNIDQMNRIKNIITSNVLFLEEKKTANSSIIIKIPKKIGGQIYKIKLSNDGINVSTSDSYVFSSLYILDNSLYISGKTTSIKGKVTIYKRGNKIIII